MDDIDGHSLQTLRHVSVDSLKFNFNVCHRKQNVSAD